MSTILDTDSPATAKVTPGENGGLTVEVDVPTYSGGARFRLLVERDKDGDFRVFVPWPDTDSSEPVLIDGMECFNGILYLGAPDGPVESMLE